MACGKEALFHRHGDLHDIQWPAAAAGTGHHLGRTGKSSHQPRRGVAWGAGQGRAQGALGDYRPLPAYQNSMTGDGGGAPLTAKGPKGTLRKDVGQSTCPVVYDLTLTDEAIPIWSSAPQIHSLSEEESEEKSHFFLYITEDSFRLSQGLGLRMPVNITFMSQH